MRKGVLHPILLAGVAGFAGLPAYLLAEHLHLLPPALRDRPWPLEIIVLVSMLAALSLALSSRDRRGRLVGFACSLAAALSLLALVSTAHVMIAELPPASPEVSVGSELPALSLPDDRGGAVALASLRGHGAVLLFFRGVFCPSCRAQLATLAEQAQPFLDAGVRVLGVSPDPPDVCAEWSRSVRLPFPLLSDERRRLAPALCGTSEHCVLVIDPALVVRWGRLNENWREGARPEAVLQRAYRLGRPRLLSWVRGRRPSCSGLIGWVDHDHFLGARSAARSYKDVMSDLKTHSGGCQCGKVRYEVKMDLSKSVISCNCSMCGRAGTLLAFVPAKDFELKSGEEVLKDYQFNKKHIHHLFCGECGIKSFARGTNKDGEPTIAINTRCLDGIEVGELKIQQYDGRSA